jgi:hypothetical protein
VVSILIVNWNTRAFLDACLASLKNLPSNLKREVIVVDNASTDGSADLVRERYPDVVLVEPGANLGYAAGNNLAFTKASGEFLLTLNPDTEFMDDSLAAGIEILKADTRAGALGAKQIGPDGEVQQSIRGFPTAIGILGDVTGLGGRFPKSRLDSYRLSAFNYEIAQEAPQPMGTFLLFKRTALETIGDPKAPYDPAFPIFFNEVDLLLRLQKGGWHALYSPDVHIKHHGGESTKQVRKSMIWESHRSLVRFLWKHRSSSLASVGLAPLAVIIYAAAFVRARGYDRGFRP